MSLKNRLQESLSFGYQLARTAHFAGQQLSLPVFEQLLTGRRREAPPQAKEKRLDAFREIGRLLKEDSANITAGLYPLDVLKPLDNPLVHYGRYARILWDGVKISRRREKREAHDFEAVSAEDLAELPEYYRRNFHYQTDGYLSEHSAELYEHQVEILFAGAADAMRRLVIPLLKEKFPGDGQGLHFLEVAAGTGRLTRFLKLAYPKARITVSDLSWPYLKVARQRLSEFDRLEFVQAPGENLPFKDQSFDAVLSCYLFHELPLEVRRQVLAEGRRVLKPGGVCGLVDSIQMQDATHFSWALESFPRDFHEPFYTNYVKTPMDGLLSDQGFAEIRSKIGFLSKAWLATRA